MTMKTLQENQNTHIQLTRQIQSTPASAGPVEAAHSLSVITPSPAAKKARRQITLSFAAEGTPVSQLSPPPLFIVPSDWTVATLVYRWYADRMYIKSDSVQGADKTDMNRWAKLLCYCKRFMDSGTVIATKPSLSNTAELSTWTNQLRSIAAQAENRILAIIRTHAPGAKRIKQAKLYSTYKALRAIPIENFPIPQVVDKAVSDARAVFVPCLHYGVISEFHS